MMNENKRESLVKEKSGCKDFSLDSISVCVCVCGFRWKLSLVRFVLYYHLVNVCTSVRVLYNIYRFSFSFQEKKKNFFPFYKLSNEKKKNNLIFNNKKKNEMKWKKILLVVVVDADDYIEWTKFVQTKYTLRDVKINQSHHQ